MCTASAGLGDFAAIEFGRRGQANPIWNWYYT
jgi:hypothetical protein